MSGEKSKGIGIIIVLLILAIAIAFISFYYVKISKTEDANKIAALEAEIETLKAENDNYKKTIEKEKKSDDSSENTEEKETIKWDGDITKVDLSKLKKENAQYEQLALPEGSNRYATLYYLDGKVGISVKKEIEEMFENLISEVGYTFNTIEDLSDKIILDGVSDVKMVYFGTFGQDFWKETPVLFLMKDGTIKYDTFENVVKNQVSPKSINNLKDIVQIYSCSVADIDPETGEQMGGAMTSIAVDKNGIAYDISDYMK